MAGKTTEQHTGQRGGWPLVRGRPAATDIAAPERGFLLLSHPVFPIRQFGLVLCLIATASAAPLSAMAQSATPCFDCSRATTATERLICSNEELARLDKSLDEAFQARHVSLDTAQRATLVTEQRQWLREFATKCAVPVRGEVAPQQRAAAISCFAERYRARIAALAGSAGPAPGGLGPSTHAVVDFDERPGATEDARLKLARIQSNLERVAAGEPPWPLPNDAARDPLETIVDAYALFLKGDTRGMDTALADVSDAATRRRPSPKDAQDSNRQDIERQNRYFDGLDSVAIDKSALVRLLIGLRRVDGTLFLEAAGRPDANPESRRVVHFFSYTASRLDDTWLHLPCRTVLGRASEFAAAAGILGEAGAHLFPAP